MNKPQTLAGFWEDWNALDGHYAIWTAAKIPHEGSFVYGFSGAIVRCSQKEGIEDAPEWLNKCEDHEVNMLLLEEIPTLT